MTLIAFRIWFNDWTLRMYEYYGWFCACMNFNGLSSYWHELICFSICSMVEFLESNCLWRLVICWNMKCDVIWFKCLHTHFLRVYLQTITKLPYVTSCKYVSDVQFIIWSFDRMAGLRTPYRYFIWSFDVLATAYYL